MRDSFIEEIKVHKAPLFYNSEGSTEAYKLCIRHLSAAMSVNLAKLSNGYIIPNDVLHIVNLETQRIEMVFDKVKLIKLKTLK